MGARRPEMPRLPRVRRLKRLLPLRRSTRRKRRRRRTMMRRSKLTFFVAKQLSNLCSQEHSCLVFAANDLFLGISAFRCSKDKMAVHFLCKTILDILLSLDSNKQNQHSWYGSKHSHWKILLLQLLQKILVVEFV